MMILICILFVACVFCILMIFKCDNTEKQQLKILRAIDKWVNYTEDYETATAYVRSMECFETTLFRLWDWGCTRIVPMNVYEEIKPYI